MKATKTSEARKPANASTPLPSEIDSEFSVVDKEGMEKQLGSSVRIAERNKMLYRNRDMKLEPVMTERRNKGSRNVGVGRVRLGSTEVFVDEMDTPKVSDEGMHCVGVPLSGAREDKIIQAKSSASLTDKKIVKLPSSMETLWDDEFKL
jgi:hypothetical protein